MLRIASALYVRQLAENNILFCLLSTFLRKHLCQAYVNWTHNDEIDSSKLGEF